MDPDQHRIRPGAEVSLASLPTTAKGMTDVSKRDAAGLMEERNTRLADLQQLLFAESRHQVLVVLQGMDTSGKDGTIKHVFHTINPLGVRVANFKRPNDVEMGHDYLWRIHHNTPLKGQMAIFNRSHYEDVLVVRVHSLVPETVWTRRYDHIRAFEQLLVDEGTVIRKFFLHISKDEQKARLQERLDNPAKHWKFEHGDLEERKHWDDYQKAYEDALARTSTADAPWYAVPSDQKWYRNLVISQVLIDTLESLDMTYPEPARDLAGIIVD